MCARLIVSIRNSLSVMSAIQIVAGHTFPRLRKLLETKGTTLAAESPFIGAIVLKALKAKDADDVVLLEAYEFIGVYSNLMGPLISFSNDETDFLITHLSKFVQQIEKAALNAVPIDATKKGKNKRTNPDIDVDAPTKSDVICAVHAAALQAIIALLVTDPRSVTETSFKHLVHATVHEVLRLNAVRYAISENCVYSEAGNRKLLYELLELLAKYPMFPKHRPLHIALHVFPAVAVWDVRDSESNIPTFCRNALLTLELITDPVIAPHVSRTERGIDLTESEDREQLTDGVNEEDDSEIDMAADAVCDENDSGSHVAEVDSAIAATVAPAVNQSTESSEENDVCMSDKNTEECEDVMETTMIASSPMSKQTMDMITISDDSGDDAPTPSTSECKSGDVVKSQPTTSELSSSPTNKQQIVTLGSEEVHKCDICGSMFTAPNSLKAHRTIHGPFKSQQTACNSKENQTVDDDAYPTSVFDDPNAGEDQVVESIKSSEANVTEECIDDLLAAGDFEY